MTKKSNRKLLRFLGSESFDRILKAFLAAYSIYGSFSKINPWQNKKVKIVPKSDCQNRKRIEVHFVQKNLKTNHPNRDSWNFLHAAGLYTIYFF